jgi:hypothetical protein
MRYERNATVDDQPSGLALTGLGKTHAVASDQALDYSVKQTVKGIDLQCASG